jgi:hypothetical protein
MFDFIAKSSIVLIILSVVSVMIIKRFVYFRPSNDHIKMIPEGFIDVSAGGLHGWYASGRTKKVVLVCQANGGNLSYRTDLIQSIQRLGHAVVIFDYPGYGHSPGVPSQKSLYSGVEEYMRYLLIDKGYDRTDVVLYGESLGAAVATHAALVFKTPTLIIDSGIPSVAKYIGIPIISEIFAEFNTEAMLREFILQVGDSRVLSMHSKEDEIIDWDSTNVIRDISHSFIEITGGHNNHTLPWASINEFVLNRGELV